MIEDLSKFSADRKRNVQSWYQNVGKEFGVSRAISLAADFSGCPCIVICHWIAEVDGWSEELMRITDLIMQFYGYTEILGEK